MHKANPTIPQNQAIGFGFGNSATSEARTVIALATIWHCPMHVALLAGGKISSSLKLAW
jgi:hypothetical protein